MPDVHLYYLCAQAQYAHYWFSPHEFIPHVAIEHWDAHPTPLSSLLTHDRRQAPRSSVNTINSTITAWQTIARLVHKLPLYSPLLPIAHHQNISVTQEQGAIHTFAEVGLVKMQDVFNEGAFLTSSDLAYIQNKTTLFSFYFHRLKAAFHLHYPSLPAEPPALQALQVLITAPTRHKLITKLYCAVQAECPTSHDASLTRWNENLDPPLSVQDWEICCQLTGALTSNSNLLIIHVKFLHQCYYTPARLFKYGLRDSEACKRCGFGGADFWHLSWGCVHISQYWTEIVDTLAKMANAPLACSPQVCLLGLTPAIKGVVGRLVGVALLIAKRQVAVVWDSTRIPTVQQWLKDLTWCRENLHLYAEELPPASWPTNIWGPLVAYLRNADSMTTVDQIPTAVVKGL